MPKKNISDLGPNECIHCPTEESAKTVCKMMHDCGMMGDSYIGKTYWDVYEQGTVYYPSHGSFGYEGFAVRNGETVYPRTDFVDEERETSDTNKVQILFDPASPEGDCSMYTICGPFKTGDEVEYSSVGSNWHSGHFIGYTTDGIYLISPEGGSNIDYYTLCRHQIKKQQHTISCTDEVLGKIKEIDGVDFIS